MSIAQQTAVDEINQLIEEYNELIQYLTQTQIEAIDAQILHEFTRDLYKTAPGLPKDLPQNLDTLVQEHAKRGRSKDSITLATYTFRQYLQDNATNDTTKLVMQWVNDPKYHSTSTHTSLYNRRLTRKVELIKQSLGETQEERYETAVDLGHNGNIQPESEEEDTPVQNIEGNEDPAQNRGRNIDQGQDNEGQVIQNQVLEDQIIQDREEDEEQEAETIRDDLFQNPLTTTKPRRMVHGFDTIPIKPTASDEIMALSREVGTSPNLSGN